MGSGAGREPGLLVSGGGAVGEVVASLGAPVVDVEVAAQRRLYSIRAEGLAEVEAWLIRYRGFWDERLDVLARAARGGNE